MSFAMEGVTVRYPGSASPALVDVTLGFESGIHTSILGPNGAGKSTVLRVLLGLLKPDRGRATLDGRPTAEFGRRDMARRTALVSAVEDLAFPVSVRQFVAMGRYPHLGPVAPTRRADDELVQSSLVAVDLAPLADRLVSRLSAGELQRARLARALAQEPSCLLLDEPTAHLDLGHELEIFERVQQLTQLQALTVISVTHNVNLASRYADRIVLLSGGRVTAAGPASEVLTAARIGEAFRCPVRVESLGDLGLFVAAVPGSGGR